MEKIYQFKITLLDSDPIAWRRFLVNHDINFHELHLVIQKVMGWTNSHLYEFFVDGKYGKHRFGLPDMIGDDEVVDSELTLVMEFVNKTSPRIMYEYDFGDSWKHEIVLEKIILPEFFSICIEGENACPPEDCGGVHRYKDYLEILKDRDHPDHKEAKERLGKTFDAKNFDINNVNRQLRDYANIEASDEDDLI